MINHFAFGRDTTSITAERDIMAHIKECGHEPRLESVAVIPSVTHEGAGAELGVSADEPLCEIRRVYTAGEVPAVLTYEYIPETYIHVPAEARVPSRTILDFVAACTEFRVAYTVTSLVPAVADAEVASALDLPPGTPILCFDSLQIASTETRVAFSRSWVSYGVVRYCVVRDQGG
ncbi:MULTISPECIES: UTRA domain-containing protein [unclassified Pseudofrankia]|uniref:UTRA domain-containing protein n=1 Tax=unclassified Pseudofrankia TaxID=2994372 RepID=UPI001F521B3D|nr:MULTISPECIES: UTRA domain-containing protein [unclassified Pseudofrankia]MDT3445642.1 UTRA domain-containing protein [Pseudofrankia sp. BMG5.37]